MSTATLPASWAYEPATRTLTLDPRDPEFVRDPYPAYAAMHALGGVFHWRDYGYWCVATHEAVSTLLRDRGFGRDVLHRTSRAALGWPEPPAHCAPFVAYERHALLEREPPEHTRLRTLINRPFLTRVQESLRPRIEAHARAALARFAARGHAELIAEYAAPIPVGVICELLGVPLTHAEQLLAWSHDMVAMYQARRDEAIERRAAAATEAFSAFVRAQLAARRHSPGDDLLSALLASEAQGDRLSEPELVSTAILFLIAGHEATVHVIGNGVRALLATGADVRAAFADPRATAGTVEELLRYDTPLHLFTRYALEDGERYGVRFRMGDRVGLLLAAANHDPLRFEQPAALWPAREPNPHLSFGGGIHFCVGAPLARLELQVALPLLFEALPGLRLAGEARFRDSYHFRGLETLPLAW